MRSRLINKSIKNYFVVSKAEENEMPIKLYDIITAAGVINWVDRNLFLDNVQKILNDNGLIVVYDFWITDRMSGNLEYTKWYQKEYLKMFPKPYRKEYRWEQKDLTDAFIMENQISYELTYDFSLDAFVDFMMIQSNVNEKIERGDLPVQEVKNWLTNSLKTIFDGEEQTLVFEGYNWYIRKR